MECVFYNKDTPPQEQTESDVPFVLCHFEVKF